MAVEAELINFLPLIDWQLKLGYYGHMRSVLLSQLKNRLSFFVDKVKNGEVIIILDRNIPVAQITPIPLSKTIADTGALMRLERAGLLTRATRSLSAKDIKGLTLRPTKRVSLLQALLEERENER